MQFRRHGLRAVGAGGSYRHTVELLVAAQERGQHAAGPRGDRKPRRPSCRATSFPLRSAHPAAPPVRWYSPDTASPRPRWSTTTTVQADVAGKVVLLLDHEPGEFDPQSPFAGIVASEHGAAIRKALAAQRRGAVGRRHRAGRAQPHAVVDRSGPCGPLLAAQPAARAPLPARRVGGPPAAFRWCASRPRWPSAWPASAGRTLRELGAHAETAGGGAAIELPDIELEVTAAGAARDARRSTTSSG